MAKKKFDDKAVNAWVQMLRKSGTQHYGEAPGIRTPSSSNAPVGDWRSLSAQASSIVGEGEEAAKKILSKQGIKLSDLDSEVQKVIRNANKADAQAIALGAPRKKNKSWWMKGLDILSRPLYGVAQGAKEGFEEAADPTKDDSWLKDLGDTAAGFGKGFKHGFTGKKKTTFSDVIQRVADTKHAADTGKTYAQTEEKEAKVNPWLKYGVGLAADVALDPTTYAGVGLITKGLHGKGAIKAIKETGIATKGLKEGFGLSAEHAAQLTGAHLAPVENLSKRTLKTLDPEIVQLAKDFQKEIGRKGVKNLRKDKGSGTRYLGTKLAGTTQTVGQKLSTLDETGKLTETLLKNVSPDIKKQLALRAGKAHLPIPGVATGVGKAGSIFAKARPIEYGITKFNDAFRARAGINPALHGIRNEVTGGLGQRLVHYGKNLRSVYDEVPEQVRRGVLASYRKGATDGNNVRGGLDLLSGQNVKVLDHFSGEVNRISQIADNIHILPEELNAYLPSSYRAAALKRAGATRKGNTKYAATETQHWLKDHIKTSEKFSDPAKALHFFNAAVEQVAAKRSMDQVIGQTFGVAKNKSVGKGGKELLHHSPRTKMLQQKGWREVKGISELKGTLFHPDVAHGVERMNEVFRSRDAVDGFAAAVEKATSAVKSSMTIYNPGFHPRTMMGEVLLTYLGGVPVRSIPYYYERAGKIMRGRDRELLGTAADALEGQALKKSQIRTANVLHGGQETTELASEAAQAAGHRGVLKTKYGMKSADEIWHAYLNSGVKSGFASSDLVRANADKALLGKGVRRAGEKVHGVSEFVEDTGRLAHFSYLLAHSKARTFEEAVKEAGQQVMKYHLDYTGVTRLEHKISAYGVPFYKWLRLSTPLMADILLHNPGRVLNVPKGLSALSKSLGYDEGNQGLFPGQPDEMVPSFLRNHGAYPLGGGNTHYYDPTSLFPVAGSVDLLNEGSLSEKINPLLAVGARGVGLKAEHDKRSWPQYLTGLIPQSKFAYNETVQPDPNIDRLERLLMFLGNPGIVSNTPKKIRTEAYKDRDAAYKNRKKKKQELGIK